MRRVVITGMGAITPIGNSVSEMWDSVMVGTCGIDYATLIDIETCPVKVAGEVKNYDADKYFNKLAQMKLDRFSQFALIASQEAYKDSGLEKAELNRERFSVVFGSGIAGGMLGQEYSNIEKSGYESVSKMTIIKNLINMPAANIAIKLKAYGSCTPVATACATGGDCIGKAFRDIRDGYSDIVLAGASEAGINPVVIGGFAAMGTLTKSDDPKRASIPFDKERSGFVMGEGAGAIILEEYEHAKKRNAHIYAELAGYGTTCDAYNLTAPDSRGRQGKRAMKAAMEEAGIEPKDIPYINAHGTSTKLNDIFETTIIRDLFFETNPDICVSSTKSMTGHLLGASGAIEAVIATKALCESFVPPTIGYKVKDEACNLNYVAGKGFHKEMNYVMSNSFGFGGHNAVLVLKRG